MREPEFEIIHFSYRPSISKESGYGWYNLNLIFRAHDNFFKNQCLKESKDWSKTEITTDVEKAKIYLDNITVEFTNEIVGEHNNEPTRKVNIGNKSEYKREDVFISGYEYHMNPLLIYKEKFDVFQYREFTQMNLATKGIISYIEEIKSGPINSRFLDSSQFLSSIKALDLFWD